MCALLLKKVRGRQRVFAWPIQFRVVLSWQKGRQLRCIIIILLQYIILIFIYLSQNWKKLVGKYYYLRFLWFVVEAKLQWLYSVKILYSHIYSFGSIISCQVLFIFLKSCSPSFVTACQLTFFYCDVLDRPAYVCFLEFLLYMYCRAVIIGLFSMDVTYHYLPLLMCDVLSWFHFLTF